MKKFKKKNMATENLMTFETQSMTGGDGYLNYETKLTELKEDLKEQRNRILIHTEALKLFKSYKKQFLKIANESKKILDNYSTEKPIDLNPEKILTVTNTETKNSPNKPNEFPVDKTAINNKHQVKPTNVSFENVPRKTDPKFDTTNHIPYSETSLNSMQSNNLHLQQPSRPSSASPLGANNYLHAYNAEIGNRMSSSNAPKRFNSPTKIPQISDDFVLPPMNNYFEQNPKIPGSSLPYTSSSHPENLFLNKLPGMFDFPPKHSALNRKVHSNLLPEMFSAHERRKQKQNIMIQPFAFPTNSTQSNPYPEMSSMLKFDPLNDHMNEIDINANIRAYLTRIRRLKDEKELLENIVEKLIDYQKIKHGFTVKRAANKSADLQPEKPYEFDKIKNQIHSEDGGEENDSEYITDENGHSEEICVTETGVKKCNKNFDVNYLIKQKFELQKHPDLSPDKLTICTMCRNIFATHVLPKSDPKSMVSRSCSVQTIDAEKPRALSVKDFQQNFNSAVEKSSSEHTKDVKTDFEQLQMDVCLKLSQLENPDLEMCKISIFNSLVDSIKDLHDYCEKFQQIRDYLQQKLDDYQICNSDY